ncbi:8558_t:CDS:1, partial [Scutellospora calospora]
HEPKKDILVRVGLDEGYRKKKQQSRAYTYQIFISVTKHI